MVSNTILSSFGDVMLKKDCPHYPCHDVLEDCTHCYCPFYPCYDGSKGYWYESGKTRVWDCSKCNWIHMAETVRNIDSLFLSTQFPI
jgi:precorrin-3B C17-methyltransferase